MSPTVPFPADWIMDPSAKVILILLFVIMLNASLLLHAWFVHPESMTQMTLSDNV
jgi:hypothetical protein